MLFRSMGGRWTKDYLVCPLMDFQVENKSRRVRVFRIREVVPDATDGYIFPLRKVSDTISRTLGPHGDSTTVHLPRRDQGGSVTLFNKVLTRSEFIKNADKELPDEPIDHGSGSRGRHVKGRGTSRPFGYVSARNVERDVSI